MLLMLTCALCTTQPVNSAPGPLEPARRPLLESQLILSDIPHPSLPLATSIALDRFREPGSGGDNPSDSHSDHMTGMWVVMGVMMAVMMVGMGAYLMRHGATAQAFHSSASLSPAQLAVPVSTPAARGGG
jgi:hypothetical protein